jgi:hypothetical protein
LLFLIVFHKKYLRMNQNSAVFDRFTVPFYAKVMRFMT